MKKIDGGGGRRSEMMDEGYLCREDMVQKEFYRNLLFDTVKSLYIFIVFHINLLAYYAQEFLL